MEDTKEIQTLYQSFLDAWNRASARDMTDQFTVDGEMIGFDGSQVVGRDDIFSHLHPIFQDHVVAKFFRKVKKVSFLSQNIALLRAIAGMVPPGKEDINPAVNTHHTLIAVKVEGNWYIKLFQNTPAQFHGRPELVEQMTGELRELL